MANFVLMLFLLFVNFTMKEGVIRSSNQEWLQDVSNDGKPSGDISLEIAFNGDDPDGQWTTHVFNDGDHVHRLSRGQNTAIVIEGLSRDRERQITLAIHTGIDERRGTQRGKILGALGEIDGLKWAA